MTKMAMNSDELAANLRGAAQSLLLPLSSRALESAQQTPIIRDEAAVQLLAELRFNSQPIARSQLYHTIICLRTRRFDEAVSAFLAKNPEGMVVNLGCGLDTRFERIDNGRALWFEIDFPEVIDLRRKLIAEQPRRRFFASSITGRGWLGALSEHGVRPTLFFAEGVFMFLDRIDVRCLFSELAQRFPRSTLLFDAVKPVEVNFRRYHPTLRRTQAELRWGLSSGSEVESWHPSLRLNSEWFYCEEDERRLGWYRLLRYVPWLGRTAWMLQFEIVPS